jgi:hypothetical protein
MWIVRLALGLIRVFFHPDASIAATAAAVTAINQTLLRSMRPATTRPRRHRDAE